MEKKTLRIQDLADEFQSFLLLDEKNRVIWISHRLRKDLLSAGLESSALLGRNLSHFRERLGCQKVSFPRVSKGSREEFSRIELCGQELFLTEMNLGHYLRAHDC